MDYSQGLLIVLKTADFPHMSGLTMSKAEALVSFTGSHRPLFPQNPVHHKGHSDQCGRGQHNGVVHRVSFGGSPLGPLFWFHLPPLSLTPPLTQSLLFLKRGVHILSSVLH